MEHEIPQPTKGSELLYRFRDYKRLSQRALAKALGIDQPKVCRMERGFHRPGLSIAVRIEALTGGMVPCGSWLIPLERAPHAQFTDISGNHRAK